MDFTLGTDYDRCAMVNANELSSQSHQRVQTAAALHSQRQTMEPFKPPQGALNSPALGHMYDNDTANGSAWRSEQDSSSYEIKNIHTAPPGLVPPEVPSRGTFGHPIYCGPPCKYAGRSKGCRDCKNCLSCHICRWTRRTHGLRGHERLPQDDEEILQANEAAQEVDFGQQLLDHLNSEQAAMEGSPTWGFPQMHTNNQARGYAPQIFEALERYDNQIEQNLDEDYSSDKMSNLEKLLAQFPLTPPTEAEEGSSHSSDDELSFTGGDAPIQWPQQAIRLRF